MSVNSAYNLKALLLILLLAVSRIDSLLIKHKQPKAAAKQIPHTQNAKALKHAVPPKERQLSQSAHHRSAHKTRLVAAHRDAHLHRELNDTLKEIFPIAVVAMMAYMIITAPFFGFILFGVPLFLNSMSTILGNQCDKPARLLKQGAKKKDIMEQVKSKLTQDVLTQEGRKLLKFLKGQNVQFGEEIAPDAFMRLLIKYASQDSRFKHRKDIKKQLKVMVDSIYGHKEKLADVLNKAT